MVRYTNCYENESQLEEIVELISKDLSEPYSVFTYRYFLHNWPHLCHLAFDDDSSHIIGVVLGKTDVHKMARRGYIAMLVVDEAFRGRSIGKTLVKSLLSTFLLEGVEEIVLETEVTNMAALRLYGRFGFVRDKRLPRYYLNGSDAYRLKLWTVVPFRE